MFAQYSKEHTGSSYTEISMSKLLISVKFQFVNSVKEKLCSLSDQKKVNGKNGKDIFGHLSNRHTF